MDRYSTHCRQGSGRKRPPISVFPVSMAYICPKRPPSIWSSKSKSKQELDNPLWKRSPCPSSDCEPALPTIHQFSPSIASKL